MKTFYKSNTKSYFQKLKRIKSYGESIFNGRITLHATEKEQTDVLNVCEFLILISMDGNLFKM